MQSRRLIVTLLVLVFLTVQLGSHQSTLQSINNSDSVSDSVTGNSLDNVSIEDGDNQFSVSADPLSGVLDPVVVEQYGYSSTGMLPARTDSGTNVQPNISIDNGTGWRGSEAQINLYNMKREFVENGLFEDGIAGTTYYPDTVSTFPYEWDASWYDPSYGGTPGEQNLSVSYDEDEEYVVLQTVGEFDDTSGYVEYRHYDGTYIYWNQTIDNTPDSDNQTLSFMYNYDSGVIDKDPVEVMGYVWLDVWVDGVNVDYIDLLTECDSRGTWYEFVVANLISLPSRFNVEIGIYIESIDPTYYLTNPGGDYDEDQSLDFDNARINRVLLDNVTLLGTEQPSFVDVGLTFHAGAFSTPVIEGINNGTAVITNPSYWNDSSLSVGISSSANISCDYEVTLLSHNFGNSTWTTQPTQPGVAYTISPLESASLSMYTYIGSEGVSVYENFTVLAYLPSDWENFTVYDPFLNDETSQCKFSAGLLEIPTAILDRLGWWQITLESPNYAKSVSAQIRIMGSWFDNTLFRSENITRASVELGTNDDTPLISDPVNMTWYQPDESIWYQESASTGVGGVVETTQTILLGSTTIAGEWTIEALWTNGTEVAYGTALFDMYHSATLDVPDEYETINIGRGLVISNFVYFEDADTSEYLLDDSVTIEANWSGAVIPFTQDFVKNWWRGEFDTSLIEGGQYTVVITASRPYFDNVTVQFTVICTFDTTLDILNADETPIERGLNEVFTVQIQYDYLNGTGIAGASIDISHSGPGGGLAWSNFVDFDNGHYSVDIICDISAIYPVTILLDKLHHYNATDTLTLDITATGTEFDLLNGTADVVRFGDSYRLVMEYRNSTGQGLPLADLEVVTVTPETGLLYTSFTNINDGYYEVTLTPSTTGTFSIVISASIFNHETQYATFTLTGVVIPSVLTSLPSSTSITVNQSYTFQLSFTDEYLVPINSATIELIDSPSGIFVSGDTFVGSGLYNITIRSSEIAIYNLLFRASATNYQSSIVGFTVSVTALPTVLDITNAGTIPVETGLNEVFTVQLNYELLNGTGVPGALPILVFSGPAEGLLSYNFIDSDNGLYSIDIICNVSSTYGITITMAKPYYYNTTDSFTLIVGATGSELELLNGTADAVLYSDSYRLVVDYRNSTGYGLAGADVIVVSVTPETGLVHTGFAHIFDGFYEITLTPSAAGTFSIVICANITNHETQYTTFTLTASGIPTILTSIPSEETVAINQTYTLQLRFMDESLSPIEDENITLINPPAGLTFTDAISVGNGYYNITLESSTIQTFDLLFRATADNYQSSSAGFTFVVTEIQTSLSFAGDISSTVVDFAEPFSLTIYYNSSSTNQAVQGANIAVIPAVAESDIQVTEFTGYYIVTIRGNGVGSWALSVIANRTDYRIASKSFFIEIEEIDTTVEGSSPLETLLIGRPYDFTFRFIFDSNSSNIRGGTIVPTGSASDWVTYLELGSGQYSVNLTPQELGEHSVLLTFEKVGFESRSFRLTFDVSRVPLAVEVLQGLSGPERLESVVNVQITEDDTGDPVSGVEVFCIVLDSNGAKITDYIALTETAIAGVYSGSIPMPAADGEYQLEITCDAADYVMNANFAVDLEPARDLATMLWVTTERYYPIMIGLFALCAGIVYRRSSRKKRIRENKATLAIKHRFDDIRSLMGVIVLHKESGLPIYSKILRDGLEETVISAFITAITSFRGEFDIESSSEEWGLIPISDIVRVISTNKLVCAFITTGNPSPAQRERMISFAKTVGFIFDDTMDDVPIVVLDHHTTMQFNSLFEDFLDGQLLRTYKLDEVKKFPTTSCANERIARKHGEEFKLEELATEIASCGLEEGRVYKAIMDALENEFLVTTDDSPFATELLRAPDTISDES